MREYIQSAFVVLNTIAKELDGRAAHVYYLNAGVSGIFMKLKAHGSMVEKGETIGIIVNPLTGDLLSKVKAPGNGWLFTIREYPVVDERSLLGRILRTEAIIRLGEEKK